MSINDFLNAFNQSVMSENLYLDTKIMYIASLEVKILHKT